MWNFGNVKTILGLEGLSHQIFQQFAYIYGYFNIFQYLQHVFCNPLIALSLQEGGVLKAFPLQEMWGGEPTKNQGTFKSIIFPESPG